MFDVFNNADGVGLGRASLVGHEGEQQGGAGTKSAGPQRDSLRQILAWEANCDRGSVTRLLSC